jgi:hypothetical protein
MSTYRYSGEIRIRVTYSAKGHIRNGYYRCHLTGPGNMTATIVVGVPEFLSHAVDSPEAFDDAARAALAFADHDADEGRSAGESRDSRWGDHCAYDGKYSTRHVGRSLATAWPKDESTIVNKTESPIVKQTQEDVDPNPFNDYDEQPDDFGDL